MRNNDPYSTRLMLFFAAAAVAVFALAPPSFAAHHGSMGMKGDAGHQCPHHKGHGGKHGQGAMKGCHGAGHGKAHGRKHGHGGHHGKTLYGPHWKTTLSPEQAKELDRLRVEYAKRKAPLKAKAQAVKLHLSVLATADEPDTAAINARIDDLLKLKRQMMEHKYGYVAAKRRVLTPEQRVSFDMDVLKRSKHKGMGRH